MFWKCLYCEKSFNSRRAMQKHRHFAHFSNKNIKNHKNYICPYCNREKYTTLEGNTNHIQYCKYNPNHKNCIGHRHSEKTKLKLSSIMKQKHLEGKAWNIGRSRWNSIHSYPEQFFLKVIMNEFDDKNVIQEYNVGNYSLDFAWVNKKKYIEIDGNQHERFIEYKERDMKKDKLCKSLGWTGIRIKWKDMMNNTKYYIKLTKEFIGK